jgi:uncharacterized glyoxalase superfamily protein PhnB
MSDTATKTTQVFYPALRYVDAPAAIAWLKSAFGFEDQVVYTEPDGKVAHAQLTFDGGVIMLGSTRDGNVVQSPRVTGTLTSAVYVYVENVDAHYERAKSTGAKIHREITDTDYGSREYSAFDCEGYIWSFGTYHPS